MESSAASNSVPVRLPSSTLSSAISVHDSSSNSAEDQGTSRFIVHLYADYKHYVVLPDVPNLTGNDRWITIKTAHGRTYKIEMVQDGGGFLLDRGWSLFAAIENLQQEEVLMFEQLNEDTFNVSVHTPSHHAPPTGLSTARIPSPNGNLGPTHLVIDRETTMSEAVMQAVQEVWNVSSISGPIYVSRFLTNPSEDDSFVFNKIYSNLIPQDHANVAMRFVGSNTIIPGAIKTYGNHRTRMIKEWPLYAREHNLTLGEIFVCKIHRGPAAWEFVGFCAGR